MNSLVFKILRLVRLVLSYLIWNLQGIGSLIHVVLSYSTTIINLCLCLSKYSLLFQLRAVSLSLLCSQLLAYHLARSLALSVFHSLTLSLFNARSLFCFSLGFVQHYILFIIAACLSLSFSHCLSSSFPLSLSLCLSRRTLNSG